MFALTKGRYRLRLAQDDADLWAAQNLRGHCFRQDDPQAIRRRDEDAHDALCHHILIEDIKSGALVGYFRVLPLATAIDISRSYSAQFYDLGALSAFDGTMAEMGRFCVHPETSDPDILRLAWGAMTQYVDEYEIKMLLAVRRFGAPRSAAMRMRLLYCATDILPPRSGSPRSKHQTWSALPSHCVRSCLIPNAP